MHIANMLMLFGNNSGSLSAAAVRPPWICTSIFTARQHSLLCRLQSAVLAMMHSVWPSDCLSVRHTLVSCQNDSSYDHAVCEFGTVPCGLRTLDISYKHFKTLL